MRRINPYKRYVGSMVPNWLLCRKEVSQGAKLCYARLAQYAGEKGYAFPLQSTIAAEIGVEIRQVKRYLAELEKHSLIYAEQQGLNRPNVYSFLLHPWMEEGEEVIEIQGGVINDTSRSALSDTSGGSYTTLQGGHIWPTEENHLREENHKKKISRARGKPKDNSHSTEKPHSVPIEEVHALVSSFIGNHSLEPPKPSRQQVHANDEGEIEDEDRLAAARWRKALLQRQAAALAAQKD
jgi:hypothetical protein